MHTARLAASLLVLLALALGSSALLMWNSATPARAETVNCTPITALPAAARDYIERVVFARNWGPRLRDRLTAGDWNQRAALCDADAPTCVLADPDYYCPYPISVVVARR